MKFDDNGCLPPGIHTMTWDEFYEHFSFSPKRKELLVGLHNAITVLKQCGCTAIYIDGSFATAILEPNDYDACWEGNFNSIYLKMKEIEPVFLDIRFPRKIQKDKYMGEFLHYQDFADSKGMCYLEFFQHIKDTTTRKGIVKINLLSHD